MPVTGLLIRRHLRKRPGQTLAIAVLTLLAAMLANVGILLLLDYGENVDRKAAEWNSPDVMAVVSTSPAIGTLEQVLAADPSVTDIELSPAVTAATTLDYGGVDMYSAVAFVDIDAQPQLGQFTRISELPTDVTNPVWAPSVLAASGNYALGDAITFDTPTGSSTFHIQGFIEDLYGGVPGWGLLTFGVPDLDIQAPGFTPTTLVKVNAASPLEASQALSAAIKTVNQQLPPQQELVAWWQHDMSVLKSGAMMSASIYVAILAALAVIAVSVAAVVIRFVLRNLLATDITAIGALRAAGFTTAGIVGSLVAPYALFTAVASLTGVGLSYLLMPTVETSFHAQNGLTWEAGFSPTAAALTTVATLGLVLAVAGLAATRVRKTTTVAALRGGIATHSFRRTYLPLESTRGSRNVLLGLKTALQQVPQNATIMLTISATALSAVFGLGMGRNLLGDSDKATELLAGKLEDISVVAKLDADPDQILAGIAALPEVTDAYFATTVTHNVDGLSVGFRVSPDPDAHAADPVVAGRQPRHLNEVTIGGRLSDVLGLDVGDAWTIDLGNGAHEFLVTGITSSARFLGQSVIITTPGFRLLDPNFRQDMIAIEATDSTAALEAIKAQFGSELISVVDVRATVDAQLGAYLSAIPIVNGTVIGLTTTVTALVVGLIVTTMLVQSRRDLGIKKAMGFTNRDLRAQTRWAHLPAVTVGALLGCLGGAVVSSPLHAALLRGIGILQVDFATDWALAGLTASAIVALAWFVSWGTSLRISRISAYALVAE